MLVALFVSTRSFIGKGVWKKSMSITFLILAILIFIHYQITTKRMQKVELAFAKNQKVVCENRENRKTAQFIIIQKDKDWNIKNHTLTAPQYNRGFYTARCLVYETTAQ